MEKEQEEDSPLRIPYSGLRVPTKMHSNTHDPLITFEQVVNLAQELSPLEKLRLIERLAPDLEAALQLAQSAPPPRRRSLRGILRDSPIDVEELDIAREEMWANFPREDF